MLKLAMKDEDTVGPHGLGNRNERGEKLIEWAKSHGMIIGNTWFEQHPRRLWTLKSPGEKTFPGPDCGSDHTSVWHNTIDVEENKKCNSEY